MEGRRLDDLAIGAACFFRPLAWKLVGVDALMQLHHNIHTLRGEKIAGY